jgi:hypothetical protein
VVEVFGDDLEGGFLHGVGGEVDAGDFFEVEKSLNFFSTGVIDGIIGKGNSFETAHIDDSVEELSEGDFGESLD